LQGLKRETVPRMLQHLLQSELSGETRFSGLRVAFPLSTRSVNPLEYVNPNEWWGLTFAFSLLSL